MRNDDWTQQGMMGWGGDWWHWFSSFPGVLSLVSLTIIVIVCIDLFRDWRRDHVGGNDPAESASKHAKDGTDHEVCPEEK